MDLQNSIEMNIASALNPLGLFSFGSFVLDIAPFEGKRGILIGNHAHKGKHQMFESLMTTPEFQDGKADPLNRWTKRTMDASIAR